MMTSEQPPLSVHKLPPSILKRFEIGVVKPPQVATDRL